MTDVLTETELLAPAGNTEKMLTAFHFGADAVYLAGQSFGLRAYAGNFTDEQMAEAVRYAHSIGKKVYVTINIFAFNSDFDGLADYLKRVESAGADAVLVTDVGVFDFVRKNTSLKIHISTQANTTNKYAVKFWYEHGAERVVLARELSLDDISEIHSFVPECQLETFVHGAMCIGYSGRCLMSNYLTGRDGNRGQCVQACRWEWEINEIGDKDRKLRLTEDGRGTYIFNSKDLNMIKHLDELKKAGVYSFKIEGRMKSAFYVATVVNAYRRALNGENTDILNGELEKASHRTYTTGFFLDEQQRQYYPSSKAVEQSKFIAKVLDWKEGVATIEQRNKFVSGQTLEILSSGESQCKTFVADDIRDADGNPVEVANVVQQRLTVKCPYPLTAGDILRLPVVTGSAEN